MAHMSHIQIALSSSLCENRRRKKKAPLVAGPRVVTSVVRQQKNKPKPAPRASVDSPSPKEQADALRAALAANYGVKLRTLSEPALNETYRRAVLVDERERERAGSNVFALALLGGSIHRQRCTLIESEFVRRGRLPSHVAALREQIVAQEKGELLGQPKVAPASKGVGINSHLRDLVWLKSQLAIKKNQAATSLDYSPKWIGQLIKKGKLSETPDGRVSTIDGKFESLFHLRFSVPPKD